MRAPVRVAIEVDCAPRCTIWLMVAAPIFGSPNCRSATGRSYTRRAVCCCLRGIRKSAPSHVPTVCAYASIPDTRAGREAGLSEQSSICAYFLTGYTQAPRYLTSRQGARYLAVPAPVSSFLSCPKAVGTCNSGKYRGSRGIGVLIPSKSDGTD